MKNKKYANFKEELKLWKQGYRVVVGLDEAGRGPLAGPVVASAVVFTPAKFKTQNSKIKITIQNSKLEEIHDSKKLTVKQRELWYEILTKQPYIKWGIGIVSEKIIDKINIFEATKLAMKKAIQSLGVMPEHLLIDGTFILEDLAVSQKAIIRGDEKIFSCAAASIIAKVTRDRIMFRYAKKYRQYGFENHKGYGTKAHCRALKKHGPCQIHRQSFRPIKFNQSRHL